MRHGQQGGNRPNQHLSASRLNAPQPPPPSPALVRHGSKQRQERRHAAGARDRDPRRSSGPHLSQPSTPGTSANQLPSQGQIRMSQTPLQQSQLPGGHQIRASPDRKKRGFLASMFCCGGCISPLYF